MYIKFKQFKLHAFNFYISGLYPYQVPNKTGKALKLICSLMAFPHKLGSEDTFYHLCEKIVLNNYVNGEVIRLDGGLNSNYL